MYLDSEGLGSFLIRGKELKDQGNYLQSITILEEGISFIAEEGKIEVYFELADLYALVDDFDMAKNYYNKILELDDKIAGAWYGLAYTNEIIGGDKLLSLDYYKKAIEIDPSYQESYYYAATILGDLGRVEEAIEYLYMALDINPDDYVSLNDLGAIFTDMGDLDKSVDCLLKSININSNYYLSHFNLGVSYYKLGLYDKAEESYLRARDLKKNRYIYLNLSALYIEKKEYRKAIAILTEGIYYMEDHFLYYNRACVYSLVGELDLSRKDFQKAREIDELVVEWGEKDPDLKFLFEEEK